MLIIKISALLVAVIGFLLCFRGSKTALVGELKEAIDSKHIITYYQPIVNYITGEIHGVEVLARWIHPIKGIISPDVFIPIAEKNGLIITLTQYIMQNVKNDLDNLSDLIPENFHIGINVSATYLKSEGLSLDCLDFIHSFAHKKISLVLEITEREPINITKDEVIQLMELRSQGVKLALDDFGTGYSGLSCLINPIFDIIKIDKIFVSMIGSEHESSRIVDCIIELTQKMSLIVVAEGVETRNQVQYLIDMGVELLQGYFVTPPLTLIEFANILLEKRYTTSE
ncbi:EAL domain-containing protein [Enterobacter cloacae subsp. cloacae]|uniref:EAL domain-containing protein n=1 Tax=Enterobacter cloacae TaxID=550 RepID=UPI000A3B7BD0|nr:EAL domain-containing protein [Enterobacter cloacae]MBW4217884.1 EAL domain-containing protein [Enterobacter cloacae subsp. cloacae]OUF32464.1 hypothetical protein AZZ64_004730 [Enterobacter cloacae]